MQPGSVAPVVAAIVRKQKELVAAFRAAGATTAATAVTIESINVESGMALRVLRGHSVIREASPNTFFLDEANWEELSRSRRRAAISIVVGALIVVFTILVVRAALR